MPQSGIYFLDFIIFIRMFFNYQDLPYVRIIKIFLHVNDSFEDGIFYNFPKLGGTRHEYAIE